MKVEGMNRISKHYAFIPYVQLGAWVSRVWFSVI